MGISRVRAWLAVAALALGFEWTTSSDIIVQGITLWSQTQNRTIGQGGLVAGDGSGTGPPSGGHIRKVEGMIPADLDRRDPQGNVGNGGGLEVQLALLYFEATWGNNGHSYSQFFGVSNFENRALAQSIGNGGPAYPETGIPPFKDDGGVQTTTATAATTAVTAITEPTNASDGALGGGLDRPTSESANNNGGGLAVGAIIGIAVGCGVAGLLLILGLAWYLLRRHRKKKALHSASSTYGTGARGEELMAEKEASADVDVTPHSPYSDEGAPGGGGSGAGPSGHGDGTNGAGAVAAGAIAAPPNLSHLQDPPRSFTPYSDRPSVGGTAATAAGTPSLRAPSLAQTDEVRVSVPSPIPGRATPRGLTTPYAHLVEEGMTEDEIRRLEDEERQLDAAIEQAGRR
ncbi:predicted protein [Chaetomium globosum CBS 148.51]|uniref:Mid2 domain-containing protein n=1 Tax=Chaetomium globosum (strain ATCC 6205 / CBS 148.51 / DSM 1962 / NBRC 6347 / NRRL 1970) TaxID=306901 RepID=Q2HAH4_CHAGB|nr:uncharacterized protein CHGG_02780 [Chaetomium globosum CBS 148.51]EAQ90845.1 predicted protein [Chaetomium globosum CBS 148.51]